ncbi:MAG TPA: hypothetical protein VNT01_13635 [Symbiobacteriaceae bacterium]|nr:hypothetical protein [Symbiobacteriaceae bacterium]
MLLRAQEKWEVKALLIVLLLHLLQAWFWFGKFPFHIPWEIQGALMLPMAIQLMPVMIIYMVPWVAVPIALLLLGWPLFTGVGCTTCQS